MPQDIDRDALADLVGVNFNTLAVWRHKGLVSAPTTPGTASHPSRYDADSAFEVYCFSLAAKDRNVRQEGASTVSRYLHARRGAIKLLVNHWPSSVALRVCPAFDLASFSIPNDLLQAQVLAARDALLLLREQLRLDERGSRIHASELSAQFAETAPIEYLLSGLIGRHQSGFSSDDLVELRQVEERSDPELSESHSRAAYAARIFRNQKAIQYGGIARPWIYPTRLDQLDLTHMPLDKVLTTESWAFEYLDDVIEYNGLNNPAASGQATRSSIDIAPAVQGIAEAFGWEQFRA